MDSGFGGYLVFLCLKSFFSLHMYVVEDKLIENRAYAQGPLFLFLCTGTVNAFYNTMPPMPQRHYQITPLPRPSGHIANAVKFAVQRPIFPPKESIDGAIQEIHLIPEMSPGVQMI